MTKASLDDVTLHFVARYAAVDDVSGRDLQFRTSQYTAGKPGTRSPRDEYIPAQARAYRGSGPGQGALSGSVEKCRRLSGVSLSGRQGKTKER